MKNREKYAEELLNVACTGNRIAIDKRTMQIRSCAGLSCEHCLFNGDSYDTKLCDIKLAEWAESEYIEQPKISKKDRAFLDYLKGHKYIARDYGGKLYAYTSMPVKQSDCWGDTDCWGDIDCKSLTRLDIDFPMIKWSDSEPWKVEDLKKLEVVDEYEQRNTF